MGSIRDKRFRYGTFSTIMMLAAVTLFVLANLAATVFDISRDITSEQMFSLTPQSVMFLEALEQDVHITYFSRVGGENAVLNNLLREYQEASNHITVDIRDPMLNPQLVHTMAQAAGMEGGLPEHTVVVQSGSFTRVVHPADMIATDWMTGQWLSLNFEVEITRAIHALTTGNPPIVYVVQGSGEMVLPTEFIRFMETEGIIINEVNLVLEEVPEDADILLILQPIRDWTELKAERIRAFLHDEGNAFLALGFNVDTPNLNSVLAYYGVEIGNPIWAGSDTASQFLSPVNIIPHFAPHEITESLIEREVPNLTLAPFSVDLINPRRAHIEFEPLWQTSSGTFARTDPTLETPSFSPGDIAGPHNIALAIIDQYFHIDRTITTRLVVVGNWQFLDPQLLSWIGAGNYQFVSNSFRWMHEQPPSIWIPARRPPGNSPLMLSELQENILSGFAIGVVPVLIILIGVVVWYRRRHS